MLGPRLFLITIMRHALGLGLVHTFLAVVLLTLPCIDGPFCSILSVSPT